MEQQGGTEEFRRASAMEALCVLSIHDRNFLPGLRDNLEATLWSYGFALSPREMEDARKYLTDKAPLSDDQIRQILETAERRW